MLGVMPSQVVSVIDELYPRAKENLVGNQIPSADGHRLLGIIELIRLIPGELISAPSKYLTEFVLAKSAIENLLSRKDTPPYILPNLTGNLDVVTVLR